MDEKIIELINKLPEDLRSVLVTQDANGNYSINGNKFQEALDKSHPGEDSTIIEIFFRKLCEDQWKNIGWEKIEPLMSTLIHICKDVGFKDVSNPFLKFLQTYLETNELSNDDLVKVNNLYAKDVLSYEDVHGDKVDGNRFSIIYRPELYKMDDVDTVVKTYKFLGDASNLKKMNWGSIYDGNVTNNISQLALDIINGENKLSSDKEVQDARATIIYKDKDSSELNNETILKEVLKLGSTGKSSTTKSSQSNETSDVLKGVASRLKNLSVDEQRAFIDNLRNQLGL